MNSEPEPRPRIHQPSVPRPKEQASRTRILHNWPLPVAAGLSGLLVAMTIAGIPGNRRRAVLADGDTSGTR